MINRTRFFIFTCLLAFICAVAVGLVTLMNQSHSWSLKERHPLVSSYLASKGKPEIEVLGEQILKNYEVEDLILIADELKQTDEDWAKVVLLIGYMDPKKYFLIIDEGLAERRRSMGYLNHDAIARVPRMDLIDLEQKVQAASFREKRLWLFAISYTMEDHGE